MVSFSQHIARLNAWSLFLPNYTPMKWRDVCSGYTLGTCLVRQPYMQLSSDVFPPQCVLDVLSVSMPVSDTSSVIIGSDMEFVNAHLKIGSIPQLHRQHWQHHCYVNPLAQSDRSMSQTR